MSELLCQIYYSQVQKSFTPVQSAMACRARRHHCMLREMLRRPSAAACLWLFSFVFSCLCADVDECVKAGVCSDGRCVNTEGSFQCDCQIGFTTNPEGTACLGMHTHTHKCDTFSPV